MTDTGHLGAFAHIPDGQISIADVALVHAAARHFEGGVAPILGRIRTLVGGDAAKRSVTIAALADEIESCADSAWAATLPGQPDWPKGAFAADAAEILKHAARDPSLHFGDAALKELITARAADLVVQSFEIQAFGARRDRRAIERAEGLIEETSRRRAKRDRAILEGARPYSKPANAASP